MKDNETYRQIALSQLSEEELSGNKMIENNKNNNECEEKQNKQSDKEHKIEENKETKGKEE